MDLSESLGNFSHHAYALVGGGMRVLLLSYLQEKRGVSIQGNPDLFVRRYEVFTIEDARNLKEAHATRPFAENGCKHFILEIDAITLEAQNALLKMFEEPNEYALFFLIVASPELLLPTLRSRLSVIRLRQDDEHGAAAALWNARDFIALTPAERISSVDKLAGDISDGKRPKTDALDFCASLSRHLRDGGIEKNAAALVAIAQAESYLRDRAPSVKQLLEYVALSM